MHHLSPYTNGINGAVDGVLSIEVNMSVKKMFCVFLLDLSSTEILVLFQKHITESICMTSIKRP